MFKLFSYAVKNYPRNFLYLLLLISGQLYAQDSTYRQSPSGLTLAEVRFGRAKLLDDFITPGNTVKEGNATGLGATFSTTLFRRVDEAARFRHGDFEGIGLGIGGGKTGLWLHGKLDLGWQFHYAFTKITDFGFRAYGTYVYDKIPYAGFIFHPSIKVGVFYLDVAGGFQFHLNDAKDRTFTEVNARLLIPNDDPNDMDRWFIGFRGYSFSGRNENLSNSNTWYRQGYLTLGLML